MTEQMLKLRRSPRTLLARDGHPGPGPGKIALVMSRAGVGKTAFLVGIGLDSLLAGQKVLHVSRDRSVEKVRDRYDEIFHEMTKAQPQIENLAKIQLDMERRRHVLTYVGDAFSPEKLEHSIEVLIKNVDFDPDVMIIDRMDIAEIDESEFKAIAELAKKFNAEVWLSCRTHRDDPTPEKGHLTPPADRVESMLDLVLRLDPHGAQVRLHVLMDHDKMIDEETHLGLDPRTLLLVPMHFSSLS